MIFKTLMIAVLALFWMNTAEAALSVGDQAPALVAKTMNGDDDIDLSEMQGKTVIVNLWASWCTPCLTEIPVLRDFYHDYQDKNVIVIGLSMDRVGDRKTAGKLAAQVDYPMVLAAEAKTNGFEPPGSLPASYVIRNGSVIAVFTADPVTKADLMKAVFN